MGTKTKSITPLKDEKTWHTIGSQPLSLNEAVVENAQVGERGKINKFKENDHVLPDLNKKGNVALGTYDSNTETRNQPSVVVVSYITCYV